MTTTDTSTAIDQMLAEYAERAEAVGTVIERVPDNAAAAAVIARIAGEAGTIAVMVSGEFRVGVPGLCEALEGQGCSLWTPIDAQDALDAPLGLSLAHLAVAETGSMLLNEPNLADRAVGLVSAVQVIVCPMSALVPSLDEVGSMLREIASRPGGGYASLVTGPSRTADIEMSLTVGVQGPGKVYALFVDDLR
jgi:L-lactate dehydrogenase complex protein LldG